MTDTLPESILRSVDGVAMPLERVSIEGELRDFSAELSVSQHYRNPHASNIEAVYTFPLPSDAVLLGVELELGERRLSGVVIERKTATEKYENAVTDGDTAVMVESTGPGLYTVSLGNLMPGEAAVIRYRYALLLNWQGNAVRLVLPTTLAPRYGDPAAAGLAPHQVPETSLMVEYPLDLRLTVSGRLADGEISCPTHAIATRREDQGVVVSLGRDARLDRDFVLVLRGEQDSVARVLRRDQGESLLLASWRIPPLPRREESPLRLKVVIDCSGSMAGTSIAQARKAALEILNQLRPGDQFNFVLYGSTVHRFWPTLRPAEAKYIAQAWKQLETLDADLGGTETQQALQTAFGIDSQRPSGLIRPKAKRPAEETSGPAEPSPQILLITDGQDWHYDDVIKEAKDSGHRVFTVGVGFAAAEGLVQALAAETGGACELATPQEGMTERILTQFHRLRQAPVKVKGVRLGLKPAWFTPLKKAMFSGDTVHVFAGLPDAIPEKAALGIVDAQGVECQVEAPVLDTDWTELPRLAAARRIDDPKAAKELKVQLALEHQLLTEGTAMLIVAERADKAATLPELAKVPHMLPAGWGGTGEVVLDFSSSVASPILGAYLPVPAFLRRSERPSRSAKGRGSAPRMGIDSLGSSAQSSIKTFSAKLNLDAIASMAKAFDAAGSDFAPSGAAVTTPSDFINNLQAGMRDMLDPDGLPTTIEALEDFGLAADAAVVLRELTTEGWPERHVVAAFLMAVSGHARLSGALSRAYARLVFAGWKRSAMNPELLSRIGDVIADATQTDWQLRELAPVPAAPPRASSRASNEQPESSIE